MFTLYRIAFAGAGTETILTLLTRSSLKSMWSTLLSYVVLERADISLVEFSTARTARVPSKYNGAYSSAAIYRQTLAL